MRCVAPNNPHPDWALCYNLLLKANAGYCIQLSNTLALNPTFNGWPALQVSLVICLFFVNPYSLTIQLLPPLSVRDHFYIIIIILGKGVLRLF